MTKSSSRDETANVNVFYDDIVHVLQNTKPTVQRSGSLQKFYHSKIRLTVEFKNNNATVYALRTRSR